MAWDDMVKGIRWPIGSSRNAHTTHDKELSHARLIWMQEMAAPEPGSVVSSYSYIGATRPRAATGPRNLPEKI